MHVDVGDVLVVLPIIESCEVIERVVRRQIHRRTGSSTDPRVPNSTASSRMAYNPIKSIATVGVSVRSARYRYTQWPDGSEELYDETRDPGEARNLAADPATAATLAEMRALRAPPGPAPAGTE